MALRNYKFVRCPVPGFEISVEEVLGIEVGFIELGKGLGARFFQVDAAILDADGVARKADDPFHKIFGASRLVNPDQIRLVRISLEAQCASL